MKFLFLVQGEGRGHMTQAIALSHILTSNGHEVVHTFIGISDRRIIPDYFFDQIKSNSELIRSPNFILDAKNRSLKLFKSIIHNAQYLNTYRKSLARIHVKVKQTSPDVLVNFYDFLGGFYFRYYKPNQLKHVCIGRQFLTKHPDYPFELGRSIEKRLYLINNWITSQECDKYLALSFRKYTPAKIGNVVVVPPLLKKDIKRQKAHAEDFFLGYMVNDGYAEDIISWHSNNPEVVIHCFWDRKNTPKEFNPNPNLTFHQLDNSLFNELMSRCKGFITTAGFESICEAMYLQKPVLMIPVGGQYEQACNAIDGEISGAGIRASSFDISKLVDFLPKYTPGDDFYPWIEQAESIFCEELTNF